MRRPSGRVLVFIAVGSGARTSPKSSRSCITTRRDGSRSGLFVEAITPFGAVSMMTAALLRLAFNVLAARRHCNCSHEPTKTAMVLKLIAASTTVTAHSIPVMASTACCSASVLYCSIAVHSTTVAVAEHNPRASKRLIDPSSGCHHLAALAMQYRQWSSTVDRACCRD